MIKPDNSDRTECTENGAFGYTDDDFYDEDIKSKTNSPKRSLSGLKSVTVSVMNDDSENLISDSFNVSSVPQEDIDLFIQNTEKLTKVLAKNMLNGEAKFLLSLEKASSFVQALLRDTLGIDANIDTDVMDVVSDIGRLSVIFQALNHSKIPKTYKELFFSKYVERCAELSCDRILGNSLLEKKRQNVRDRLREIEVIARQRRSDNSIVNPSAKLNTSNQQSSLGVRKNRS